jgi:folylpolyglutamate synthase/dihydrofolate synthase
MSNFKIDLSLDRINRLFGVLPPFTRPTIHVAGTNGKGSVTTLIESILLEAGFSTGKFNSPHLVHVRDCISLSGKTITQELYDSASSEVSRVDAQNHIGTSSFEQLTATAFRVFDTAKVDVAIVEVGMGGRLDATNAMPDDVVLVTGVVNIDLDHQAFLGNTLVEIAREKAGIAKNGRVCVVGRGLNDGVEEAIREAVAKIGGEIIVAGEVTRRSWEDDVDGAVQSQPAHPTTLPRSSPILISLRKRGKDVIKGTLPLQGDHQLSNVGVAITIVDVLRSHPSCTSKDLAFTRITDAHISNGIKRTKWPGRLDWIPLEINENSIRKTASLASSPSALTLLVDGAHNPASAIALANYISSIALPLPRTYILSLSHSPPKTPLSVLEPLLKPGDNIVLVQFSPVEGMPWVKNVEVGEMQGVARQLVGENGEIEVAKNLGEAIRWAAVESHGGISIVCGSLYLLADLYRLIE